MNKKRLTKKQVSRLLVLAEHFNSGDLYEPYTCEAEEGKEFTNPHLIFHICRIEFRCMPFIYSELPHLFMNQ